MRGHMFLCFPQTWFNEARTNVGLSPTMDFFNENDSLACFAILGELSSFTVAFFKTLSLLSLFVGFFRGQGRTNLSTPQCFSWLKKTKYQKIIFFAFCAKGPVKLMLRVKIARSFLQSMSNQFHVIILRLPL